MKDLLKECKEFHDGYYVHPSGRLFKLQELTPYPNSSGYLYQKYDGGKKNESVHRIVARCFLPNPNNYTTVDHIDGNKSNNSLENLQWMSLRENIRKSFSEEFILVSPQGERHVMKNVREFSEENGLDSSAVSKLKYGKLLSHKGWTRG